MKELYYYYRDKENRPLVTVCLLMNGDEFARGVAICSPLDQPCKRTGRAIARGRAGKALKWKELYWACDPVRRHEAKEQMLVVYNRPRKPSFAYKTMYKGDITPFEDELLEPFEDRYPRLKPGS